MTVANDGRVGFDGLGLPPTVFKVWRWNKSEIPKTSLAYNCSGENQWRMYTVLCMIVKWSPLYSKWLECFLSPSIRRLF